MGFLQELTKLIHTKCLDLTRHVAGIFLILAIIIINNSHCMLMPCFHLVSGVEKTWKKSVMDFNLSAWETVPDHFRANL